MLQGTNEITAYALCHNWVWDYSFERDTPCVREYRSNKNTFFEGKY